MESSASPTEAAIRQRARRDALLILAKLVGLVTERSYDEAWDELEALKPGFYQEPEAGLQTYLRRNWSVLFPPGHPLLSRLRRQTSPPADKATKLFLHRLAQGDSAQAACKAAKLPRSSVYQRYEMDAAFAVAWDEAREIALRRRYLNLVAAVRSPKLE